MEYLLLESGDFLLLESGDYALLESVPSGATLIDAAVAEAPPQPPTGTRARLVRFFDPDTSQPADPDTLPSARVRLNGAVTGVIPQVARVATGLYRYSYTLDDLHANDGDHVEEWLAAYFGDRLIQGAVCFRIDAAVSTRLAAADYDAPDNANIAAIAAKLPGKPYLAGTDNASGDIQLDEATGALSAAALANAPTGVSYTVSAPAVGSAREVNLEWQQHAAVKATIEALTPQTGKSHALVARVPGGSTTAFSLTTAGGQISASGTTITISATDSVTATAGYYEYRLWNTTDDLVIAEGTIRISDGPYGT